MSYKNICSATFVLFFLSIVSFAQNERQVVFNNAKRTFNDEQYAKVIPLVELICNQSIERDSLYWESKRLEYLTYNRLDNNDKAKSILKEVIEGNIEDVYKNNRNVATHLRNYLALSTPNEDFEYYERAIRGILQGKNESFYYADYEYYAKMLQYKYGDLPYAEKLVKFKEEDKIVEDYNKAYFDAYYNYVKGLIILDGEWRGNSTLTNFNSARDRQQIKKACSFLRKSDEYFLERSDMTEQISDYYNLMLHKIVNAYSLIGHYDAAAHYQRKKIDLLKSNWQRWDRTSPWQSEQHFMLNHDFTEYELYVELLYDSQQYFEVINYSKEILADSAFEPYKEEYEDYIEYHITRSKIKLGKYKGEYSIYMNRYANFYEYSRIENDYLDRWGRQVPFEDIIEKYNSGKLGISDFTYNFNYLKFYDYLLDKGDYSELIDITGKVLDDFHKEYLVDPLFYYNGSDTTQLSKQITEYDKIIASDREIWHHANGGSGIWLTYRYRALAYEKLGDYVNAIDNQIRCVDNVRTDWEFEPDERESLLGLSWESFKYNLYTDIEKDELYSLAEYYRKNNEEEKASIYYHKLLKLNRDILTKLFESASWNEKVKQWDLNSNIYKKIIRNENIINNPYFSDIIFECSTMLKSFLLNVKLNEHAAVDKITASDISNLWERKLRYDLYTERSNYFENTTYATAFLNAIDNSADLEEIINTKSLIPDDHMYIQLKNKLKPNEILVDFIIRDEYRLDLKELNGNHKKGQWQDFSICICKKEWEKPKIINLDGSFSYNYFAMDSDQIINTINNVSYGKQLWNVIEENAELKNGDTVYFVPSGIINNIPIEYYKIDNEKYIYDKYDLYRITSYRQLLYPSKKITDDDKWALFINDYFVPQSRYNTTCNTEYQNLKGLKISDLDALPGATNTFHHINQIEKSTTNKYSGDFTEYEFSKLSLASPELLYIGSHGYYLEETLSADDSLYLYGQYRTTVLSPEEKSMYKSGIIMRNSPDYQKIMSNKFLTAKEISLLDLSSTKLACVSACSTGLGTITTEGVYGLQRGFKLAGVQSLLVSLWDVDDKATEILISAFYDYLRLGQTKYDALKNAQNAVRQYVESDNYSINLGDRHIYKDPYYWAGFVLIDGNE